MFDIGWTEIATITILAILIIGPKDLPKAMRGLARMIGKGKAMMREFQTSVDDMIKETELEEVKNQIQSARNFDVKNKIAETVDPGGELNKMMDFSQEASDFNKSMKSDGTEPAKDAKEESLPAPESPKADTTPPAEEKPKS